MPEFGFPAQPRSAEMARIISDLRKRGDDTRVATVTGRFADVTAERRGQVSELMQIEKSIGDLQGYADSIALSELRASTTQRSLDQLSELGQNLSNAVDPILTNGTDANFEIISGVANASLESAISALNVSIAGRALFGGDDAGTAPMLDAASIFAASTPFLEGAASANGAYTALRSEFLGGAGLFETTFYQGGLNNAPVTEVAPGERVDYAARADETAIRDVLFNITVMAAAYDTTNGIPADQRRELVAQASIGLRNADSQIANLQGRVGSAEARIAAQKSRNIATEAALTLRFNDLAGADSFAAALQLTELENQLETAYATTARLSNLSLANFL